MALKIETFSNQTGGASLLRGARYALDDLTNRGGRPLKVKGDLQNGGKRGDCVFLSFTPQAAHLFDPNDGARL